MSAACQHVVLGPTFMDRGKRPDLTPAHHADRETGINSRTWGSRRRPPGRGAGFTGSPKLAGRTCVHGDRPASRAPDLLGLPSRVPCYNVPSSGKNSRDTGGHNNWRSNGRWPPPPRSRRQHPGAAKRLTGGPVVPFRWGQVAGRSGQAIAGAYGLWQASHHPCAPAVPRRGAQGEGPRSRSRQNLLS